MHLYLTPGAGKPLLKSGIGAIPLLREVRVCVSPLASPFYIDESCGDTALGAFLSFKSIAIKKYLEEF